MQPDWAQNNPSNTKFIYAIIFNIFHNKTKRKALFSLKTNTVVYVLSEPHQKPEVNQDARDG